LNRIVRLLTHMGVLVAATKLLPGKDERVRLLVTLEARDSEHLSLALQRVSTQQDVERVRVVGG
jgi:hypothetical protein